MWCRVDFAFLTVRNENNVDILVAPRMSKRLVCAVRMDQHEKSVTMRIVATLPSKGDCALPTEPKSDCVARRVAPKRLVRLGIKCASDITTNEIKCLQFNNSLQP